MSAASYQLDGREAGREAFYATACDPRRHVVVEACAGAGKTWMLVARIVRALVDGAEPQEILAITFTRKAAGEMRTRLAAWLREASAMNHEQAVARLVEFGLPLAEAHGQAAALIGLHERLLLSGRTVEVQTFHAWYAQLLRAAPMDLLASLGLAPGTTLLEDISDLKPALMLAFHAVVLGDETLRSDYRQLCVRHGRHLLGAWFDAALARRAEVELAAKADVLDSSVEPASARNALATVRDPSLVALAHALARQLAVRDKYKALCQNAAQLLVTSLAVADDQLAYDGLRQALFTENGAGTPRKQLGELPEQAALCDTLSGIAAQVAQAQAHEDHNAMVRLSRALFSEYRALKQRRNQLDMTDLERVALTLLADHALSGWIQERLDARVRHLLVDEFQDTSPLQWHALYGWLSAYAGAGGGGAGPRLFIVGDPKQSIYRFRRAEPRVFEAAQRFVVDALGGSLAACDHTRRCAPGLVDVLNTVFGRIAEEGGLPGWRSHTTGVHATAQAAPSLARLASAERPERARRQEMPGERVWRPSLTTPRLELKTVLREAEAGEVARAIETLVRVEGVAPQDIMVLARRRAVLAQAADALAALRLPHVAPENLRLIELPEVQDLLAVLDVLASPGQALSLARALKSPLFGASDAELLTLAQRARTARGWWPALMSAGSEAAAAPALRRAAELLAKWQAAGRTLPPHDLLDRIVHDGDLLPRLAATVPPQRLAQAMAAVRSLLAAALELDGGRYASPYNFVRALRQRQVLAPPAQHLDAVRLLTIHGAKGLEAKVVFLMDADAEPPRPDTASLLVDWPVDAALPQRVAFLAAEARCPPSLQALLEAEQQARAREEANALYVAMTRAQERLVVSRTPPLRAHPGASWWARLEALASAWPPAPLVQADVSAGEAEFIALPLNRSGAARSAAPESAVVASQGEAAALLGQAIHRTLEWATLAPADDLERLAAAAAAEFGVANASEVLAVARRILTSPECRQLFDRDVLDWAGNEVSVAGVGARNAEVLRIDRLVRTAGVTPSWWVLDYKLGGQPQSNPAYIEQLAAYRCAVQALQPGETVRAAFISGLGELIELA